MRPGVLGEVRHDAHLDLRVVGGEQRLEALARDERRADLAALLGADRDVLQVRVVRGDAAGAGAGLVVGGVDAPVAARPPRSQRLDDLLELRGVAVLQQQRRGTDAGSSPAGRRASRRRSSSPVLVARVFGMPSSSKSTSCSCFGEPRFTSWPISRRRRAASRGLARGQLAAFSASSASASTATPAVSISASTAQSGQLDVGRAPSGCLSSRPSSQHVRRAADVPGLRRRGLTAPSMSCTSWFGSASGSRSPS